MKFPELLEETFVPSQCFGIKTHQQVKVERVENDKVQMPKGEESLRVEVRGLMRNAKRYMAMS